MNDEDSYEKLLNDRDSCQKVYDGAFVLVQSFADKVFISQDFIGCWGLYLFQKDGYFAISNSFLFLVENLKTKTPLMPNFDYLEHSLLYGMCSCSIQETPVKEIAMLPRDVYVAIEKNSGKLEIIKKEFQEGIYEPSSEDGIRTLDEWYFKWTSFTKNFVPKIDYNIQTDLSGGFESRMVLMLLLCSGIDVSKIRINSAHDNLHCHAEDYEIASMMAEFFGFKLNENPLKGASKKFSLKDTVDISFYTKLGFHKELYWKKNWRIEPIYCFTGAGANLKEDNVLDFSKEEFLLACENKQKNLNLGFDLYSGFAKCVGNSEKFLSEKYESLDGQSFGRRLYQEGRNRHHYGKSMAESWFSNKIDFTPMLDPIIQRLKFNYDFPNLIPAIMFLRYKPELLNFKFEGKRFVDEKTIEFAKRINGQFPFKNEPPKTQETLEIIFKKNNFDDMENPEPKEMCDPLAWCQKVYESQFAKQNFSQYFPKRVYDYAEKYRQTHSYFPLSEMYGVIAVAKYAHDCEMSLDLENRDTFDLFTENLRLAKIQQVEDKTFSFSQIERCQEILHRARIDIKIANAGIPQSDAEISIKKNSADCKITKPAWFSKDGAGYVIECPAYETEIEAKCLNDCRLKLFLRSCDIRRDGIRLPIFINYDFLQINNGVILSNIKPCSHDQPFRYECDAKTGDVFRIKASWNAHGYSQAEFADLAKKIMDN